MDRNLGSSPPSGTEGTQEEVPKKKTARVGRKRNTNGKIKEKSKGNGKTTEDGEADWLKQLCGLTEAKIKLMEERDAAIRRCLELEKELKQRKRLGLDDERSRVKLMSLFSFFSRMVNFQARCEADKRKIDKMVSEVQSVMRSGTERLSK